MAKFSQSYFIGISLENSHLVDLFVDLQRYIREHRIEKCLYLQDISSLHLTLYWWGSDATDEEKEFLEQVVESIREDYREISIHLTRLGYLKRNGLESIGYLDVDNQVLPNMNRSIIEQISRRYSVNSRKKHIPHITLFRVKNFSVFKKHRQALRKIIDRHIDRLKDVDFYREIRLYSRGEKYEPVINIPSL